MATNDLVKRDSTSSCLLSNIESNKGRVVPGKEIALATLKIPLITKIIINFKIWLIAN